MALKISHKSSVNSYDFWNSIYDDKTVKPRLSLARGFFTRFSQGDIPLLVDAFKDWRDYSEFLLLRADNRVTNERKFFAVKCSKRGNDVFARRLDQKLGFLKTNMNFFNPKKFDERQGHNVKTKILWITLTYNSNRCSLEEAWKNIGSEFNLWITNLRNKYGKVWYVAFPQAFPNQNGEGYGYPHFHVIMLFEGKKSKESEKEEKVEFHVFRRMEKNREGKLGLVYRIKERYEFENQGKWHSFIDIKALSSMRAVWNYAKKHCYNAGYGSSDEASLNNAVMWLFKKKSFNMSGEFRKKYIEFITALRSSKVVGQKTLDGDLLKDWIFSLLGVFSFSDLGLLEKPVKWRFDVDSEVVHSLMNRFR